MEIIVETPIQLESNSQSTPSHYDMSDCGDSARKGAQPKPIPKEGTNFLQINFFFLWIDCIIQNSYAAPDTFSSWELEQS